MIISSAFNVEVTLFKYLMYGNKVITENIVFLWPCHCFRMVLWKCFINTFFWFIIPFSCLFTNLTNISLISNCSRDIFLFSEKCITERVFRDFIIPTPSLIHIHSEKKHPIMTFFLHIRRGTSLLSTNLKRSARNFFSVKANDSFRILISYCSHDNSVWVLIYIV